MSGINSGKGTELILEERKDALTTASRVYYGYTTTLGAAQTDPVWQIYAIDVVGAVSYRSYANDSMDFDKQWNLRVTYFGAVSFMNQYSLQLTGAVNSYLLGPASADYNFANTAGFSIGAWFKTTNGVLQTLLNKTSGANSGYTLQIDSMGRVDFEFRATGIGDRIRVRTDAIVTPLTNGTWRFVCVTKASGSTAAASVNVYTGHNGVLTDEVLNVLNDTLVGATTSATQIGVGASNAGASRYTGNIDEISIWNAELTLAEVTEVYNVNNGVIDLQAGSGQIAANLAAYWRFGDGSFAALPTIPDEQGANDLTAQAAVVAGDVETEVPP